MNDKKTVLNDYSQWLKDEKTPAGKIKVIDASLELFSTKGFNGTSTKEIATESGMSEATIFKYFATKENLLMTIIEPIIQHVLPDYRDQFIDSLGQKEGSLQEIVHYVVRDRFKFAVDNKRAIIILSSQILTNEKLKNMFLKLIADRKDDFVITLQKAFGESPEIRKNIDIITISRLLVGQILTYFLQCYKLFETPSDVEIERGLQQIEDVIYYAIKE